MRRLSVFLSIACVVSVLVASRGDGTTTLSEAVLGRINGANIETMGVQTNGCAVASGFPSSCTLQNQGQPCIVCVPEPGGYTYSVDGVIPAAEPTVVRCNMPGRQGTCALNAQGIPFCNAPQLPNAQCSGFFTQYQPQTL